MGSFFQSKDHYSVFSNCNTWSSQALQAAGILKPVLCLGLPDTFIEHGDPVKLLALQGLDAAGIESRVRGRFSALLQGQRAALKVVA